jgi:hypothetical protein
MKLSQQQIERLYRFTREHFVEWYDLQTELVDHLANAIETQWQDNPGIPFEEALQKEFKKFGVFGFMDVVEKRQAAMTKKYNKIVLGHVKEFFGVPKIVLTTAAILLTYLMLKVLPFSDVFYLILVTAAIALSFAHTWKAVRKQNKKKETGEKRWLFDEIIRSYGNSTAFSIVPIQVVIHFSNRSPELFSNDILVLAASILLVLYTIITYVMLRIIPSMAEEYLHKTYPEYGLEL